MVAAATQELPSEIWDALKDSGLIDRDYQFVG